LKWTFEDEPTDEVVDEIIKGLRYNKDYYGGAYMDGAYWVSCAVDALIYNIGLFLDDHNRKDKLITFTDVHKFIQKAPESVKVIVPKVMERLKIFNCDTDTFEEG